MNRFRQHLDKTDLFELVQLASIIVNQLVYLCFNPGKVCSNSADQFLKTEFKYMISRKRSADKLCFRPSISNLPNEKIDSAGA